jgi:hypothetical protein
MMTRAEAAKEGSRLGWTVSRAIVLALIIGLAAGSLLACTGNVSAGKRVTKVSGDLLALHESYEDARRRGVEFRSDSPTLRIVDDRVAIDATATGDVGVLEADLVRLGLCSAASFGRVVSGELPITAIPTLETLPSLAFARPSMTIQRRGVPERSGRP